MPPNPPRMKVPLRAIDAAGNALEGVDLLLESAWAPGRTPKLYANRTGPTLATPPFKSNSLGEWGLWHERGDMKASLSHALLTTEEYYPAPVQMFDVRDFGARGDGANDDFAAIQDCINAARNNGIVFFSPGDYLIAPNAPINIYSNTMILGSGDFSRIIRGPASSRPIFSADQQASPANIVLRDLTLDAGGGIGNAGASIIKCAPGPTSRGSHIRFERLRILDALDEQWAIQLHNCDNIWVRDCLIERPRKDGINCQGVHNAVISGNVIRDSGPGGTLGDDHIAVTGNNVLIVHNVIDSPSHPRGRGIWVGRGAQVAIVGNQVNGGFRAGISLDDVTFGQEPGEPPISDVLIADNVIDYAGALFGGSIWGDAIQIRSSRTAGIKRVVVANNQLLTPRRHGVGLRIENSGAGGVNVGTIEDVDIHGNRMFVDRARAPDYTDKVGSLVSANVAVGGVTEATGFIRGVSARNNSVHSCYGNAIQGISSAQAQVSDFLVTANHIVNCGRPGDDKPGIYLENVGTFILASNFIRDSQGASGNTNGIHVVNTTPGLPGRQTIIGNEAVRTKVPFNWPGSNVVPDSGLAVRNNSFKPWTGAGSVGALVNTDGPIYFADSNPITINPPTVGLPRLLLTSKTNFVAVQAVAVSSTSFTVRAWSMKSGIAGATFDWRIEAAGA